MTEEEKLKDFEERIIPPIQSSFVEVANFFEQENLSSAYLSALMGYLENFLTFNAKRWEEQCEEYGVTINFKEIDEALKKIRTLDEFVEMFQSKCS